MDTYINELGKIFVHHHITLNNFQLLFESEKNEDNFIKLTDNYNDDLEFINHLFYYLQSLRYSK